VRAIAAGFVILLAACSSDPKPLTPEPYIPPSTEGPCGETTWPEGYSGWEVVCAAADAGHFLSVWGSSPSDVYIVGGKPSKEGIPGETAIWHWDGATLAPIESPGKERAWWVFGTDADHVFVVGERGLGLVRENRGPFVPFETGTDRTIFGLWASSPERLYYVSGDFVDPAARGELHVRTPEGAQKIEGEPFASYTGRALFKVWGAGETVFAVGENGAMFRLAGGRWSRLSTPNDRDAILTASGFSATEVYAVGGRGRGVIWGWNGVEVTDLTPIDRPLPGIMGVHAAPDKQLFVSGENGLLATLTSGVLHEEPQYTEHALHAVWGHEGGGAWAVGGNLLDTTGAPKGAILRKPIASCGEGAVVSPGYHHLDLQGRSATPRRDGSYPMFDQPRGRIHPDLVHGEHYLLGPGSFVEFTTPLCGDITDKVAFRLANNDESGSVALHQLIVRRGSRDFVVAEARDDVPGNFGYIPFDRSSLPSEEMRKIADTNTHPSDTEYGWEDFASAPEFESAPRDILTRPGDTLVFRSTNVSDQMYGLMIWFPQSGLEYQSFVEVEVTDTPGGEDGEAQSPPPQPGPCEEASATRFIELGQGVDRFQAFPPAEAMIETGPQGSLMFVVAIRGKGFEPGNTSSPNDSTNPLLLIRLALDRAPSRGGRIVADGFWRRGFGEQDGYSQLLGVRPTVPSGAATLSELLGHTIFAEVKLVEPNGATLCTETTFTGRR
jgi:hypothetical protein